MMLKEEEKWRKGRDSREGLPYSLGEKGTRSGGGSKGVVVLVQGRKRRTDNMTR